MINTRYVNLLSYVGFGRVRRRKETFLFLIEYDYKKKKEKKKKEKIQRQTFLAFKSK